MKLIILIYAFLHHSVSIVVDENLIELEGNYLNEGSKLRPNNISEELRKSSLDEDIKVDNDIKVQNTIEITPFYSPKIHIDKSFVNDKLKAEILKVGCQELQSLAIEITNHYKPSFEITKILDDVIENYVANLSTYFNVTTQQQVTSVLEKEFYFLDIIESANKIFHNISKILLNEIIVEMDFMEQQTDTETFTKIIQGAVVSEKKKNLNYICENVNICKHFPSYSDHVAELLGAILKLPNSRFQNTVEMLQELFGIKLRYYKKVMNDEIAFKIRSKLNASIKSQRAVSQFFSFIRGIIKHRFNLFMSKDGEVKKFTKAIRILIDVIDKAFEVLGEEFIGISFDNIMKSINYWAQDDITDEEAVKTTLAFAINNFFDILNRYWDQKTKAEVKVLIEVIMMGTSDNHITHYNLFETGSKFTQNDNYDFGIL